MYFNLSGARGNQDQQEHLLNQVARIVSTSFSFTVDWKNILATPARLFLAFPTLLKKKPNYFIFNWLLILKLTYH